MININRSTLEQLRSVTRLFFHIWLTTHKAGVYLPCAGTGHSPVFGVPANHSAVLAGPMSTQVCPHAEQVQLHISAIRSWGWISGTTAHPQRAVGGDGLSDDGPLCYNVPINLEQLKKLDVSMSVFIVFLLLVFAHI